ncbi:MAG: hypothetical protein K2G97_05000, partial [Oscillospiraceae bacterium]|nr:hypothetical protein [Oscillospiraceae bacterium]
MDAGKIENCGFEGKVEACVDSEKVLGIAVDVTVGVILIIAIVFLLKYLEIRNKKNQAKSRMDKIHSEWSDTQTRITEDTFDMSGDSKLISSELPYAQEEIKKGTFGIHEDSKLINTKRISESQSCENFYLIQQRHNKKIRRHSSNIATARAEYAKLKNITNAVATSLFKNGFFISLIAAFIGGAVSGVAARLTAGSKYAYLGGFCGVNAGEINNCRSNSVLLKAKTLYNKYNMCGGFVGVNGGIIKYGDAKGNEIYNKVFTGGYLGGFAGENFGKIENGTTTVSVTNGKFTGGFCGNNSGEINAGKSEGNVTASSKTVETKCGGFLGENSGVVNDCTSIGVVAGQEYVGGFCGENTGEISKSKSEGNAKASTKVNTNRCGGFIGENRGTVKDSNSKGNATGEECVGGFIGMNKLDIIDCYASGKATAKTKMNAALAGGFVGENEKGTIANCTATGGADSRSSSGHAKAGGFVGVNKATITNSKATGDVYLIAGIFYKDNCCGGFAGQNAKNGNIEGCYAECKVETKD